MSPYRIDASFRPFRQDFKAAAKKFRSIKRDVSKVFTTLESNPQAGKPIPSFSREVWKIRVGVEGHTGKSSGYRLIYHVDWERRVITPLTFYFKGEIERIPDQEIEKLFKLVAKEPAAQENPPGPTTVN